MDSNDREVSNTKLPEGIRRSWIPLAAVGAAFAAFVSAIFRTRPVPAGATAGSTGARSSSGPASPAVSAAEPPAELKNRYRQTAVVCGDGSSHPFRRFLADICTGPEDSLYCLGDDEIRVFDAGGRFLRSWKAKPEAACLEVGPDKRVYVGSLGRVDIYTPDGVLSGGMDVGDRARPGAVTAIKLYGDEMLVADAAAKIIRRYDSSGKQTGAIGDRLKTGSFMLPNGWLDFDIDSGGIVMATDTGRHRVTEWLPDGTPIGSFGKFGMQNPEDFVGCCNPVNLAVTPEGNVVTAEKMVARVKVFDSSGALIAYIGPENFDPGCRNIHLEVDSGGRIIAADPVRRVIRIFSPVLPAGASD